MNAVVKEKWLNALRSGKYKKIQGRLKAGEGFCCLGVLCDMYVQEHPEVQWEKEYNTYHVTAYSICKVNDTLPTEVMAWAELLYSNPWIGDSCWNSLASFNDSAQSGDDFTKIADIIEAQL